VQLTDLKFRGDEDRVQLDLQALHRVRDRLSQPAYRQLINYPLLPVERGNCGAAGTAFPAAPSLPQILGHATNVPCRLAVGALSKIWAATGADSTAVEGVERGSKPSRARCRLRSLMSVPGNWG